MLLTEKPKHICVKSVCSEGNRLVQTSTSVNALVDYHLPASHTRTHHRTHKNAPFVPKLMKSTRGEMLSAVRQARGISIMVPTRTGQVALWKAKVFCTSSRT